MVTTPLASLPDAQAALDARATEPRNAVYIGGVLTPVLSYTGRHQAGQMATGRLTLPLPRPEQVAPWATVLVQGGHNDLVGTIFAGIIPSYRGSIGSRGDVLTVDLVGWSYRLDEGFRADVSYSGPVALDAVFVAACQRAEIPAWIAEHPTYPDGATSVLLGGNPNIDDGLVTIAANESPLRQLQRWASPYEYAISDTGAGPLRLHRLNGVPDSDPVVTFREGVHLVSADVTWDYRDVVNVYKVIGASYEDELGGGVSIESIADPDEVDPHADIPQDGYRYEEVRNSDLVRWDQADAVRQNLEIKHSAVYAPVRWEAVAVPGLAPGDVVAVETGTLEIDGVYWLTGIDITSDDGGFVATYEGWAGAGEALAGIVDRVTVPVQTTAVHLGDETVSHYKVPAPSGTYRKWDITIPEDASAVNVRGYHHSWNSQTVAGEDTDLTVSRWEVYLPGVDYLNDDNRAEASGTMPHQPERYYQRLNFSAFSVDSTKQPGDDGYVLDPGEWAPFAINLGRLEAGDYQLVFRCGEDAGYDDGEVIAVYLEAYGTTAAAGSTT